jgi:signal peptidase II
LKENKCREKGRWEKLLALSLLGFVLDRMTKYYAVVYFDKPSLVPSKIAILKWYPMSFSINYVRNQGGAWGVLASYPKFLLLIRSILILFLFFSLIKEYRRGVRVLPYTLILTGAISNMVDFFSYNGVVDMVHFEFFGSSFPLFNIADTLIFLGVSSLMIRSIFLKKGRRAL